MVRTPATVIGMATTMPDNTTQLLSANTVRITPPQVAPNASLILASARKHARRTRYYASGRSLTGWVGGETMKSRHLCSGACTGLMVGCIVFAREDPPRERIDTRS